MKIRFTATLLTAGVGLAALLVTVAATRPEDSAEVAALKWLSLVDDAKYAESWSGLAATFKKVVSKREWVSMMADIRRPLGKVVSRKLKSSELTKDLPGAPEGEYVVLKFDTVFQNKTNAVETVTPVRASDLLWRVSGYSVK